MKKTLGILFFLACGCAAVLAGGFFGGLGGYRIDIEWILYF